MAGPAVKVHTAGVKDVKVHTYIHTDTYIQIHTDT